MTSITAYVRHDGFFRQTQMTIIADLIHSLDVIRHSSLSFCMPRESFSPGLSSRESAEKKLAGAASAAQKIELVVTFATSRSKSSFTLCRNSSGTCLMSVFRRLGPREASLLSKLFVERKSTRE